MDRPRRHSRPRSRLDRRRHNARRMVARLPRHGCARTTLDAWSPVSPVTGALDAVEWREPVRGPDTQSDTLAAEIADLLAVDLDDAKLIEGTANGTATASPSDPHIAPDDPGEAGEDLVKEVRTSRKNPPTP